VVLLCDSVGRPIGIPSPGNIRSDLLTIVGYDFDISYGYVSVENKFIKDDGFIYGFYDKKLNKFLGKLVLYGDLLDRGINNIYLAVMAFDADGDVNSKIDYIGGQSTNTFTPINFSPKMICPVYSVKMSSLSSIKVAEMTDVLGFNEPWPLKITRGSFIRNIVLSNQYIYTDWKARYLNQLLLCTYNTSDIFFANKFSRIFGEKCKDIKNEIPIIISSNRIKVRHTPFLTFSVEAAVSDNTMLPVILPAFSVYIRSDQSSTWAKIPDSEIKDFNSESGEIEFVDQIISSDPGLIKIDYTITDSSVWIYQSEGIEIPLNPFINSDSMDRDKPLYIYLMPTKIEKLDRNTYELFSDGFMPKITKRIPVLEYANSYPVHFTYNPNLFNKLSYNYDPIALPIAIIYYSSDNRGQRTSLHDIRIRGGGITSELSSTTNLDTINGVKSYWDMYSLAPRAYPKGGYIIIRLPDAVKDNFQDIREIYDIVSDNITAGVSYEIQNLAGVTWRTKTDE